MFNIYPALQDGSLFECGATNEYLHHGNLLSKNPPEIHEINHRPMSMRTPQSYPNFNLYPPVYPFFDIYPHLSKENTKSFSSYSKYSDFIVYPDVTEHIRTPTQTLGSTRSMHYPTFELYSPIYPCHDLYPSRSLNCAEEPRAVNMRLDYQYPAFNLYSAVYPYFELWPPVDQPQIAPFPKANSRLTHSELYAMVMMEAVGSTGSFRPLTEGFIPRKKLLKSHQDLHHEIFSRDADLHTPSGTGVIHPASEFIDLTNTRAHLMHSGLRPLSRRLGLPSSPSPSRGLPPPPMNSSRLSSAFESIPTLMFEGGVPPSSRVSSSRMSSVKRLPPSRLPIQETAEQQPNFPVGPTLTRSFSAAIPESAIRLDGLDRSHSMSTITRPTRPTPRRRDSIVLQRVKAYNASQEGTTLSMETLSQFPTPPLPALPMATRTPKALNRSKYPFA
ncbi:hypothetical protein BDZ94DRAFT_290888 [Collybia nuda]|uniref:Uncharacterized protein n=1 Tax=Collybia nuda TaxID=64659 RepID=A0A9P6CCD1_9AGAR|nr:hypothetical protein BDZ94DRAFT_290888 [Collybia nuda]